MNEASIEDLADLMYDAKETKEGPQPIFFLGAGASVSGGIPLSKTIIDDIFKKYPRNRKLQKLDETSRTDYAQVIGCLSPINRNRLLKGYVDEARINVCHIYLAQLVKKGYVDYVLTVNFDNLMIRALALYNIFPAIYDMAILRDLTTSEFHTPSVIYLHGQHYGLWLLNTPEEMSRVKDRINTVFSKISNNRPWVFIGYSASDPIFKHIKAIARFDNGLYWVTHKDKDPNKNVMDFLNTENRNAYLIRGYDADTFMMKLSNQLGLEQPEILTKPFSSLKQMLGNIVDIEDEGPFKGVSDRLEIAKKQVDTAIEYFEEGNKDALRKAEQSNESYLLKKRIIKLLISSEDYPADEIKEIEDEARKFKGEEDFSKLLAVLFNNWGNALYKQAVLKEGQEAEDLYKQAIEKFERATKLKQDYYGAYYNWGLVLSKLAEFEQGHEVERLYKQAFEKFEKATGIKPDYYEAYNNWGLLLSKQAVLKEGQEAEDLYKQAIEKFERATKLKQDYYGAYYNWGLVLSKLAEFEQGHEVERLYKQAFEKFKRVIEIQPDFYKAYFALGRSLFNLAKLKGGQEAEDLYKQSIEKYTKALEIKPDLHGAYNNWGIVLYKLAELKSGPEAENLYKQAFKKFKKALQIKPDFYEVYHTMGSALISLSYLKEGADRDEVLDEAIALGKKAVELGGGSYNLACAYALKGDKHKALEFLDKALAGKEIPIEHVGTDKDWDRYRDDPDFMALMAKYAA